MRRHPFLPLSSAFTLLGSIPLVAAPSIIGLGPNTEATAISADGTTVCGKYNVGAFYWSTTEGLVTLPIPGSPSWDALGVSGDGTTVVGSFTAPPNRQACRWDSAQGSGIGYLPGTPSQFFPQTSAATAISSDATTIVGFSSSSARAEEAFKFQNGTMVGLGVISAGTGNFSKASAVSADGSTVVGQSSSAQGTQGFRVTDGQAMIGLGTFPNAVSSEATGVSGNGTVVVGISYADDGDNTLEPTGFRWTAATGMKSIRVASRLSPTECYGISQDGSVIVGSAINLNESREPLIWSEATGAMFLRDLLIERGINLNGFTLNVAVAVSADGDTITGTGGRNGTSESWMLTGVKELLAPVVPLPDLTLTKAGASVTLDFNTIPGYLYQAEKSPDLSLNSWSDLGTVHSTVGSGTAGTHQVTDPGAADERSFYRVTVEEAP